ncbi:unnamed protein product [Rhodiola kirilowii]
MVAAAPLSSWPWENMGNLKYLLYGPFVGKVLYSWSQDELLKDKSAQWCLGVLVFNFLRYLVHDAWSSFNAMLWLNRNRRIVKDGSDFKQIDREWDWDNYLILQVTFGFIAYYIFPFMVDLPLWSFGSLLAVLVLHISVSEPLFYWAHRLLHENKFLFSNYHSLHHSSPVPHPQTAEHLTVLEHLILTAVTAVPIFGSSLIGFGSISTNGAYLVVFDFLRCLGHCNVEVFSSKIFDALPFLKYLIYTPSYHTLHHQEMSTNFCLFMPIYDALWNTLNPKSWDLQKKTSSGENSRVPDFVFLAHVVDLTSSMHAPFVLRSYASKPYKVHLLLLPFLPVAFLIMLAMWVWSKVMLVSFYKLRGNLHQTWVVPRFGFQYFLPFAADGINKKIEEAILTADKIGVKVISLAALNKNEALNGGGTLFVNKHPDLKVRVVHGNTLTAAVIINEIPKDVKEVFLTGATSKLGRAIALYLCRRGVRVLMLTLSNERFQKIQKEAPPESQNYLVQVTKYQAAQHCKTWIVGKWITLREQNWAPSGTHFHQFVVPPILAFRRDCTYGDLAAMKLPEDVQGLASCEYTMERGVVHACHAGGVVHFLEGYTHHEVGAIEVDRIDKVWEAAMRHGLKAVTSVPKQIESS